MSEIPTCKHLRPVTVDRRKQNPNIWNLTSLST